MSSSPAARLTITDVAFGGNGVARHDGKVWFVPFTIAGETVTAEVVRSKKNFVEADLAGVEEASPDRVEPRCPYFGRCGGCAYQHIAYAKQLEIKAAQVEQTLHRVGKLAEVPMRPIVASPQEYAYRNRIRVHVREGRAGFYEHGSHALIEIAECPISSAEVNAELQRLRSAGARDGDYTLSTRHGEAFFEQTNDLVAQELLRVMREATSPGGALLVDAYCGAGFFAHQLADRFLRVIGVEQNAAAVAHARRTAAPNESYIAADVSEHLGEILGSHEPDATTVILDPPAIGIAPRVGDLLLGARPARIIYVSCNPATLARDLGLLCRGAYRVEAVTPLDMFPQTAEIEVVACLVRA